MTGAPWHFEAEKKRTPPPLEGLGRKADQGRGRRAYNRGQRLYAPLRLALVRFAAQALEGRGCLLVLLLSFSPRHEHLRRHACRLWHDGQPHQRHAIRSRQSWINSPPRSAPAWSPTPMPASVPAPRCRSTSIPRSPPCRPGRTTSMPATGTMGVSQTAMTQIQQIASNFLAQTSNLEGADCVRSRYHRRLRATGAGAGG